MIKITKEIKFSLKSLFYMFHNVFAQYFILTFRIQVAVMIFSSLVLFEFAAHRVLQLNQSVHIEAVTAC